MTSMVIHFWCEADKAKAVPPHPNSVPAQALGVVFELPPPSEGKKWHAENHIVKDSNYLDAKQLLGIKWYLVSI